MHIIYKTYNLQNVAPIIYDVLKEVVVQIDQVGAEYCFMQNSFQFLGADAPLRPRAPTHQLFAATASILPSTLPPLHHVDLKGYSVAVSSELGNY
jgi:hypothetical protein